MWRKIFQAFTVALIGGTILSIIEVDAQSTVDDSASCESSTFDETVDLIRQEMNNVGLLREDLEDVKNILGSNQQQNNATSIHIRKNLKDLKVAYETTTQQQNNASSSFNEALNLIREDLADVKSFLGSNQQQNNASSINSKKDLDDLKAAFDASTQQQRNASSSVNEALNLIREDLADVKSVLGSNQQQNNATCISQKDLEDLKAACASNQQQDLQTEPSSSKQAFISSMLCEYISTRHCFYDYS